MSSDNRTKLSVELLPKQALPSKFRTDRKMVLDTSSDVVSEITRLRIGLGTPDKDIMLKPAGGDPADHGEASVKTVKVSVTALPTPPFSPALTQDALPMGLPELAQPELSTPPEEKKFGTFYCFPLLPPELRLKIWYLSFLPRTIELHTRRMHYADSYDLDDGGNPKWRSSSTNPAALSVNTEARCAALEHYTVPLRLASPIIPNQPYELPSALYTLSDRVLHISPEHDTVVLLGDLHYTRLKRLLDWFRLMDPARYKKNGSRMGLRKIAMSTAPWAHAVGAATLRAFARTLFADIDEFSLFMYADRVPPAEWEGGRCVLREASGGEGFFMGFGKQFMDSGSGGRGWMRVGRGEMKVADISFEEGWQ